MHFDLRAKNAANYKSALTLIGLGDVAHIHLAIELFCSRITTTTITTIMRTDTNMVHYNRKVLDDETPKVNTRHLDLVK